MYPYKAPLRDIQFVSQELFDFQTHFKLLPSLPELNWETAFSIVDEYSRFCADVVAPLYRVGDTKGCLWDKGMVKTPPGFKEAYARYVSGGWPTLNHPVEFGGQGLPFSLGIILAEILTSSNFSWSTYPGLSSGAAKTILHHGSDDIKNTYLPSLVTGKWTGTMCLTESHCGSDLGLLRTKAKSNDDGSYSITGSKIFITCGEHDMSENIIHIVLARLPDAPGGTKGISLFLVPKMLVGADGSITERNSVHCGSIEHKMGLGGSATCTMNFENAKGYLIGQPNRGLAAMFTFMNSARLGASIQGLAHSELGFQQSLNYSLERLQGRSLSGDSNADAIADQIIVHPDVRRMLLTQKAFSEGHRMLAYYCAKLVDQVSNGSDIEKEQLLGFMTPIAKAFMTETGFESANLAVQCFGGHGYIREWGVEQNLRDCRISTLYEGTTGMQSLDLIGRKVLGSGGASLRLFVSQIQQFCEAQSANSPIDGLVTTLASHAQEWMDLTSEISDRVIDDVDEVGAVSVDYMMYSGYVTLAYFWALAAAKAIAAKSSPKAETSFYDSKIFTARFYYDRILPRTRGHIEIMRSGASNLMEITPEAMAF